MRRWIVAIIAAGQIAVGAVAVAHNLCDDHEFKQRIANEAPVRILVTTAAYISHDDHESERRFANEAPAWIVNEKFALPTNDKFGWIDSPYKNRYLDI